jgi:hypothetical protein
MWNLFGKQQYSIEYTCLVRGTRAVVTMVKSDVLPTNA